MANLRTAIALLTILAALALSGAAIARPAPAAAENAPQSLTSALLGAPVAAGRFLFWKEQRGDRTAIRGYDLVANSAFMVAERAGQVGALAADGARVAWVARDTPAGRARVEGYRLGDRAATTLRTLTQGSPSEIALDGGILYYTDSAPAHRGLFARDLATGAELPVSSRGMRPVANDGALLWSEEQPSGPNRRSSWSLHLRTRDRRHTDTVIARGLAGYGGFSGYQVAGDQVVWAFATSAADARVYRYSIADGASAPISAGPAANPQIDGTTVAWTIEPNQTAGWSAQIYDLASGRVEALVEPSTAEVIVAALGAGTIALAVARDPLRATRELVVAGTAERGLRFAVAPAPAATPSGACNPAAPISCGQVRAGDGLTLADDGGRWTMRGVQFLLPQFGINDKTFWDDNYAAATADGSRAFWLDRAQIYLRANMLRIFVDMPYKLAGGTVVTPTSYTTLYAFATEANARGMRLGISLHNNADWRMTPERVAWIGGLVDFFSARGALPAIAYLNADNEINNHCFNGGRDCFDSDQSYDAQPYIDGAVGWVAQFRAAVKSRAPQLLVTAGVSTEMIDVDQVRGALNFFRPDRQGQTIASLVDFLAPHNYSAGAFGVIDDLRVTAAYTRPVVLEEYGYPTDPRPRDSTWTEGEPPCWVAPIQPPCTMAAPFFIEINLIALGTKSYAGGSAWMLADMHEKDTSSACDDPRKPFDLWTGLFAIGGTYCEGGTVSRELGQPKATAIRICAAYTGDFSRCTEGTRFQFQIHLPIYVVSDPASSIFPRLWPMAKHYDWVLRRLFHGTSATPARALAARASTNRQSERRLR